LIVVRRPGYFYFAALAKHMESPGTVFAAAQERRILGFKGIEPMNYQNKGPRSGI